MVITFVIIYCAFMVEYSEWLQHVNYWKRSMNRSREKGFIQFVLEGDDL
jgi:hypothetical protein